MPLGEEIGSIYAKLSLDSDSFTRGLADSEVKARAFGETLESTSNGNRDFARTMDDATIASQRAGVDIMKFDQIGQDAEEMLTGGGGGGAGFIAGLSGAAGGFGDFLGSITPVLGPLALFGGAIFAGWTALVALTDIIGTAAAVMGAFVAPLTVVTGLLGLLGGAFVLSGENALSGKGKFAGFADTVDHLKTSFGDLLDKLTSDFLPIFDRLAGAAQQAITYFDQLANSSLPDAMHSLATKGVQYLEEFVNGVTSVVAQPIRLAFQIAFGGGAGTNEMASFVGNLWDRLNNYLFGYSVSHPIELRPGVFKIETSTVNGIFQPLVDWFHSHDFSAEGFKIGADIRHGFLGSGAAQEMGDLLDQALVDGMKHALSGMASAWWADQVFWLGQFQHFGEEYFMGIAKGITDGFNFAKSHWQTIVSLIEHPLQLSINWPSVPGDIMDVINFVNSGLSLGGGSGSTAGRTGMGGGSSAPSVVHHTTHIDVHVPNGFVGSPTQVARAMRDAMVSDARQGGGHGGSYFMGVA